MKEVFVYRPMKPLLKFWEKYSINITHPGHFTENDLQKRSY